MIRKLLLWLGWWTLISVFFSSRVYFTPSGMGGGTSSVAGALKEAMVQWYTWGVLSLLIFWADRRFALGRPLWQRLLLHLPLSLLVTALFFPLALLGNRLLEGNNVGGMMSDPMLSFSSLQQFLGGAFQWNFLIYWLIAGGWMAWEFHQESQARKLQAAQLEQRLTEAHLLNLKAQLHPHFLFNALNTISAFVETDPRGARQMIEHLGDLLRFSLEHSEAQETTLETELRVLEHYLAIQRVRFEDHLQLQIKTAPETLPATVPSLILQPLVENAIRHGVAQQTQPVCVTISAIKEPAQLRLEVGDNGPGLPAQWTLAEHAGVGLTNTKQRLEQLYPGAHQFTVNNSSGGGVTVTITLPFRTNGTP